MDLNMIVDELEKIEGIQQLRTHAFDIRKPLLLSMGSSFEVSSQDSTILQSCINMLIQRQNLRMALLLATVQLENLPVTCVTTHIRQVQSLLLNEQIEQLLECKNEATLLCESIVKISLRDKNPRKFIKLLLSTIQLYTLKPGEITPFHTYLLELCVIGGLYEMGVKYYHEYPIAVIDPDTIRVGEYLAYFYYSGLCFIAVSKYREALNCMNEVITVPAVSMSVITTACLKKAILLSLLTDGTKYTIPKYTSHVVEKAMEGLLPYHEITKLFLEGNIMNFQIYISTIQDELKANHDWGLTQLLIKRMYHQKIIQVYHTYTSLSLSTLATILQLSSIDDVIKYVIEVRELNDGNTYPMTMDMMTHMIYFHETTTPTPIPVIPILLEKTKEIQQISQYIRSIHNEIITSEQYVSQMIMMKSSTTTTPSS